MKMVDDRPLEKKSVNREVPTMPEGYYSGDQPNPNLRAFIEEHIKEHPFDSEHDDYNVPAFNEPITTTKATAIYNMHSYWSKKPYDAIQQYIQHYTKEGDLIVDPFCGSGGTAFAALVEGRKIIAIDRSPAATFITKNYCTSVDLNKLKRFFDELTENVKREIDWMYKTRCDKCGGNAKIEFIVYSQVFQCPRCMEKVPLFDCVETEGKTIAGKPKKISVCPQCYKNNNIEEIKTRGKKFGTIPVLVSYTCESGCKPKRRKRFHNDPDKNKQEYFANFDLEKIKEIAGKEIPYWYPKDRMMNVPKNVRKWGTLWREGVASYQQVDEIFSKRALYCLSTILEQIKNIDDDLIKDFCLFSLSASILNSSLLYRHRQMGGGSPTNLSQPQIFREMNVFNIWTSKISEIIKGKKQQNFKSTNIAISTESATNFIQSHKIPINSVQAVPKSTFHDTMKF